jgi:hypothetical protein
MEHGLSHFMLPSPLDRFPFLLSNLKLPVEALNGHERVLSWGLHGDPEPALLLAKLERNPFQDLWELPEDLQRNVAVGSGNLFLSDHPIGTYKPKYEAGYGEGRKANFRIGNRNSSGEPVLFNEETAYGMLIKGAAKFLLRRPGLFFVGKIL